MQFERALPRRYNTLLWGHAGPIARGIMVVGRIIGLLFIAAAVAAAGWDVVGWINTGAYQGIALGSLWYAIDVGSLNFSQAVIQRYVHPVIWDPTITTVLVWPAWAVFAGLGSVLTVAFRRRKRRRRRRN
jgi:hypothetical protein